LRPEYSASPQQKILATPMGASKTVVCRNDRGGGVRRLTCKNFCAITIMFDLNGYKHTVAENYI